MTHIKEGVTPQQPEKTGTAFTPEESTEMLQFIAANMATRTEMEAGFAQIRSEMATKKDLEDVKQELRQEFKKGIAESEYRVKDHVSREISKTRDVDYCLNEKTNEFVRVVQKSGSISKKDGEFLIAINPLV